ncbi:heme oxygenase 1 [Toxorhynchites rutilus septentrionalis]|uniref:heme oxygenase 1 n=1 Tax=Toxorhynchites rutilus septentrionalis TaxID=329112 RepID=UPI0024789B6B|nr:heme oxygenase 1 [Toxorhynchites rutilus septentrionalis]
MAAKNISFTKEMRVATRDIHYVSDALVNAKLAFALYDNSVWAEGLLIFYEVFKYLEQHVPHDFLPEELHRTEQFEQDLRYYLGPGWNVKYQPRKEVCAYIKHLEEIERENPNLLVAYVYHLYMGLLSGGQILQKRRNFSKKFNPFSSSQDTPQGIALTTFDGLSIYELKQKMRKTIDEFGESLDEDTRKQLVEESRKVFELNNEVIRTVKGVNQANVKILLYVVLLIVAYLILKLLY